MVSFRVFLLLVCTFCVGTIQSLSIDIVEANTAAISPETDKTNVAPVAETPVKVDSVPQSTPPEAVVAAQAVDSQQQEGQMFMSGPAVSDVELLDPSVEDKFAANVLETGRGYNFDVDLVYTWVNGSDPEWLRVRSSRSQAKGVARDGNTEYRFRSHDELRFSIRSVMQNAPWVRKIWIVTCCGQRPSWYREHNRIRIVDHSQIIPRVYDPPTYNSFSIETWVHHIPGLSEHFLLMNDDFFFGARLNKWDFFSSEGHPRIAFQENWGATPKNLDKNADAYKWACRNVDQLLDRTYYSETRYKVLHQAYPVTRSLYERAHRLFSRELLETTTHTFRTREDIIPHFLAMWIGIYENRAVRLPRNRYLSNYYVHLGDNESSNRWHLSHLLEQRGKYRLFCVGDHMNNNWVQKKTDETLQSFFRQYFPSKQPWEW